MKNIILLIIAIATLNSCKIMKYTSQQEFIELNNRIPFTMENNHILIGADVDTLNYKLIFDTGAGGSVITDDNFLIGKDEKDAVNFGKVTLPNGDELKNLFYPTDLCTSMFCYSSYLIRYIHIKKDLCYKNQNIMNGILGMDFIKELNRKQIYIDFNKKIVLNPQKSEMDSIKEHMILAKTEFFKKKHFKIYLEVGNQEIPFLFDTGNSAFDLAVTKSFESTHTPNKTFQGAMTSQVDGSMPTSNYSFYHNSNYSIAEIQDTIDIVKISDFRDNNAGMGFIKRYNWFIDYENEEVYFSPIEYVQKDSYEDWNDYFVHNSENKLLIFLKNVNANKFNVGDQILKVNDVEITNNNICEWITKLNDKEFDWNDSKIIIATE